MVLLGWLLCRHLLIPKAVRNPRHEAPAAIGAFLCLSFQGATRAGFLEAMSHSVAAALGDCRIGFADGDANVG
jgi:hypothetical protein